MIHDKIKKHIPVPLEAGSFEEFMNTFMKLIPTKKKGILTGINLDTNPLGGLDFTIYYDTSEDPLVVELKKRFGKNRVKVTE